MAGLVTVLSDFGTRDGYVAAMKGVMLRLENELRIVDLGHDIAPGDIAAAAYVLWQAAPHFPPDTVHLAVVDPGVGGPRRALALRIDEQLFVAPDNGLLTHVLAAGAQAAAHTIEREPFARSDASPVFHGRDVFAPSAAFLAAGGHPGSLGPALDPGELTLLPFAGPEQEGDAVRGVVIHVDGFGNLISNIPIEPSIEGTVECATHTVTVEQTYSDVVVGTLVAVRGSQGLLEIALRDGSAALETGASRGDVITFRAPVRS